MLAEKSGTEATESPTYLRSGIVVSKKEKLGECHAIHTDDVTVTCKYARAKRAGKHGCLLQASDLEKIQFPRHFLTYLGK